VEYTLDTLNNYEFNPRNCMNTLDLIKKEETRQRNTLMLIPSENYVSADIRAALGSVLTNKYSEGYPGARYYQGNAIIDAIERRAVESAKRLFDTPHANVQPYSGSPANAAIYFALLHPGDTIMGLTLSGGGHLTHGHPDITFSGKYFTSIQYVVRTDGYIDMDSAAKLARQHKPKLIVVGTTAYPRVFDWRAWREIADSVGAYLVADISHIAGLVIGNVHPSPVPFVDVVMTTTHKTLRGPRGAMILVTGRGLERDPEMGTKIDRAVFPGLQGGPHDNTTAGIALALEEAGQPEFQEYAKKIVSNAHILAESLMERGLTLVSGGTDNHLMVIDLRPQKLVGNIVAEALEVAGIVTNRNSVPFDPNPPFYPSGVRLGSPAVTTRGMGEVEMKQIADWISHVIDRVREYRLPEVKEKRRPFMQEFRKEIGADETLLRVAADVERLCARFPMP
jgi:glycine hydroxymethyltransferase